MDRNFEDDRQRTLDRLTEAYARDVIAVEEYEERVREVQAAIDGASLRSALDGIAGLPEVRRAPVPVARPRSSLVAVGPLQQVQCTMGERSLQGSWISSDVVSLRTVMGETRADFSECSFPTDQLSLKAKTIMGKTTFDFSRVGPLDCDVVIEIKTVMGEFEVIVDPDTPVRMEVNPIMAEAVMRRGVRGAAAGENSIVIVGKAIMGEVVVRAKG